MLSMVCIEVDSIKEMLNLLHSLRDITCICRVRRCSSPCSFAQSAAKSWRTTYGSNESVWEEDPGEAHRDEAAYFARDRLTQRDVKVKAVFEERVGVLPWIMVMPSLSSKRTNVSELLFAPGHGYIHKPFNVSLDLGRSRYAALEREARDLKKRIG